MRSTIFLGLLAIADSIRENWLSDKETINFLGVFFIVIMVMDAIEFLEKRKN